MNGWRGLAGAIYAGVAALFVVNALPALVNLIAAGLHWDDSALGLFASADVAGITLGSLVGVSTVRRFALRTVVVLGLILLVAADVMCALGDAQAAVVSARFVGGIASGLILAACYAMYSYSNPQRNFAAFSIGQMVSGFIAVTALPIVAAHLGWRSAFGSLAILTALAAPLAMFIPAQPFVAAVSSNIGSTEIGGPGSPRTSVAVWAAVGGVIAYIIGEGAVWTFMGRMGTASGISEADINFAFSACTLAGVVGAVVVIFPTGRLGVKWPLAVSALISVVSVCLMRSTSTTVFVASLCAFTFTWLTFSTLQFAIIAKADSVGTATIAMSSAWYAGFAVGPYLAGALVSQFGFLPAQCLGAGGVLIALLTLLPLRSPPP